MIELTFDVVGDKGVAARLDRMTDVIRARLRATFEETGPELRDVAIAGAPVSIGRRSQASKKFGPLRKSIKSNIRENELGVQLRVGPPAFYGRFIEKGVPEQTISVKRRGRLVRSVIGVRTRTTKTGTVLVAPRRGLVGSGRGASYTRRHHITGHPFMAPAFASMRDRIMAGIKRAVGEGIDATRA